MTLGPRAADALAVVTTADARFWSEALGRGERVMPGNRVHFGWCVDRYRLSRDGTDAAPLHPRNWIDAVSLRLDDPERDAREAWEAMSTAGLIGPEDVDHPRRRFRCAACDGTCGEILVESAWKNCDHCDGRGWHRHPCDAWDAVRMASDWPGVLAAELEARQVRHEPGDARVGIEWVVSSGALAAIAKRPAHANLAGTYRISGRDEKRIVMAADHWETWPPVVRSTGVSAAR